VTGAADLFVLCRSCWGVGTLPARLGPITCCTCGGAGTLTIAPIPALPDPRPAARRAPRSIAPSLAIEAAPSGNLAPAAPSSGAAGALLAREAA
jgi:hypothetical protein